ncbi:MAG: CapA family protein [Fimbriimonadaceae bacterium]
MVLLLATVLALPSSWTLVLGGDVMLNGIRPGGRPLEAVRSHLSRADAAIVNLEIPLTTAQTKTRLKTPEELRARTQFILKADPAHAVHLAEVGIDAVSLACNHQMDFGPQGLSECLAALGRAGIRFAGAGSVAEEAFRPVRVPLAGGGAIAMASVLSFVGDRANRKAAPATERSPGVAAWSFGGAISERARASIRRTIAAGKELAPFLVLAIHTGLEKRDTPTAYQVALARACVDEGADLVVMHHPHVLQGAELYRGRPILYSVGNLVSALPGSTALFHLRFSDEGRLERFAITPCSISRGRVAPMAAKDAKAAAARFDDLCRKLARRFPHPESAPLASRFESNSVGSAILGHAL